MISRCSDMYMKGNPMRFVSAAFGTAIMAMLVAGPLAAASKEKLVPAQITPKSDKLNFNWDFQQDGSVSDGSNDCYDGAYYLYVNSSNAGSFQFQCQRPMMTKDGKEYVLNFTNNQLEIQRRVRLFPDLGLVRYVDMVTNNSQQDQKLTLRIYTNLGGSATQMAWEGKTNVPRDNQMHPIPEKSRWVMIGQSGRNNVLHIVGKAKKDKVGIKLQGSGDNINLYYDIEVPRGRSVAVAHVTGQRRQGSQADPKVIKKATSSRFYRDLPPAVRRALVNAGGGNRSFLKIVDIEQLGLPRLAVDVLAIGDDTVLRGRANWGRATMKTKLGEIEVDYDGVAAIAGSLYRPGQQVCFFRDGQILLGQLAVESFSFKLDSGFQVLDSVDQLDRVVAGGLPPEGPYPTGWSVTTQDGMRLIIRDFAGSSLELATPWGIVEVQPHEVHYLRRLDGDRNGAWLLMTQDGVRVPVYPARDDLQMTSTLFGGVTLSLAEIVSLDSPESRKMDDLYDETRGNGARLRLQDDYLIVGELEAEELTLRSGPVAFPLPLTQVRSLHRIEGRRFQVRLWDGGEAEVELYVIDLPVRVGKRLLEVDLESVESVRLPRPVLKPAQRARVLTLVEQLGSEDWKKRDEASKELAVMGEMIEDILRERSQQSRDPEIKHRIDQLLQGMGK